MKYCARGREWLPVDQKYNSNSIRNSNNWEKQTAQKQKVRVQVSTVSQLAWRRDENVREGVSGCRLPEAVVTSRCGSTADADNI
jgi:hypothetical protein